MGDQAQIGRRVEASRLAGELDAILEQVERDGVSVVVTRDGRPIARLIPADRKGAGVLDGSVRLLAHDDRSVLSTGERWSAVDPSGRR